jgi:hypothetical protein
MWMTDGRRFSIKLSKFVDILGLSSHINNPKKLHTERLMSTREMALMYVPDSGFSALKIDELLPHFVVLQRMRRRTLVPRIGNSNAILAYEQPLLLLQVFSHFGALMLKGEKIVISIY